MKTKLLTFYTKQQLGSAQICISMLLVKSHSQCCPLNNIKAIDWLAKAVQTN